MANRIMRFPEVSARVGLGRTSIYGLMKQGKFPEQIKMGAASGWIEDEIEAWMRRLGEARSAVTREQPAD